MGVLKVSGWRLLAPQSHIKIFTSLLFERCDTSIVKRGVKSRGRGCPLNIFHRISKLNFRFSEFIGLETIFYPRNQLDELNVYLPQGTRCA